MGQVPRTAAARSNSTTALALFCAATLIFLVIRDLSLPHVRDVEVWFGFELRGWLAWLTAPLHWALYGVAGWGYWRARPWVWPWASVYLLYVAFSHLIWNLTSASGGGWVTGVWHLVLFSIPAFIVYGVRPESANLEA